MSSLLKILLLVWASAIVVGGENDGDSWRKCETFMAPSSLPTGGWGVFAARDFDVWEIIDIAPLFIPMNYYTPTIRNSVLDDYIYGYHRWHAEKRELEKLACVVFGNAMFYNHHTAPNVKWLAYGREPSPSEPNIAQASGFVARRKIAAGEELFSSYGEEDGGKQWFASRNLDMVVIPTYTTRKNGTIFEQDRKQYCSKLYAGIGQPAWTGRVQASIFPGITVPFTFNAERLAPTDHPVAVIKQDVMAGTTLEIAPALVMNKVLLAKTALAPTCFFWDDWDVEQQKALRDLRESSDLRVQYQNDSDGGSRHDRFTQIEDVVVLPAAGNIALVERIGNSGDANSKIKIIASGSMKSHLHFGGTVGSAGILLHLVATKDIKTGDRLRLNIQQSSTSEERQLLADVLDQTGSVVPDYLRERIGFDGANEEL
jgi:hypothetical protein